jgi:glycosyltransferase involved in cell wall biosynthesis
VELTVAICTYNPPIDRLARALDAIVPQLEDVSSAEVIVVDNNSSPALAECERLSGYPIRLVREPTPGLTAAREAAIESAQGDFILFVDDDNILGTHYLATVVEAFSGDPRLGLLGGRVIPEYEVQPPSWFGEFEPWLAVRRHARDLHAETTAPPYSLCFPVGAGFAVRRELAVAYVEDCAKTISIQGRRGTVLSSGEDTDLGLFVLSRRSKLAVNGALGVTHVIPSGRIRREYLQRLAVGHVTSGLALERKWSVRFGRSVFPELSSPLVGVLTKTLGAAMLSLWSPRYKVKRHMFMTLTRGRFGALN